MATVAGAAASPTAGYDRAFWISGAALVIGAMLALLLPGRAKPATEGAPAVAGPDRAAPEAALVTSA
jgi:hypothetical protein